MSENKKYDMLGHITYKTDTKLNDILFMVSHKTKYEVRRNGKVVCRGDYPTRFIEFLRINGPYDITPIEVKRLYSTSKINGSHVTVLRIPNRGKAKEYDVVIKANSMIELVENTNNVYEYIKNLTGISGSIDVYGKAEMC